MKKMNFGLAVLSASALLALGAAFTSMAAEWKLDDGGWVYVDNSGEWVKNDWRADGDKKYYLGSDGYMIYSTLLDVNGAYYYVNSSGAMVTNEWKFLENPTWQGDELVGEGSWYYFNSNGRATVAKDDGKVNVADIGGKKYAFDAYGRMRTGWVSETGEYLEEDEWENAMYYGDADGDGSIVTNAWVITSVPDEDNEDDTEPTYHFYFANNGKKVTGSERTIAGKKYVFDERGVAQTEWVKDDDSWKYYGEDTTEDPYLRTGWFQAVPDEDLHADSYNDGTTYWYYANSNGEIVMSQFKSIDGKTYGFNSFGELLTGVKGVQVDTSNKKTITAYVDIDSEDDIPDYVVNDWYLIYFASGDGAVKTGKQSFSLDGETYNFSFSSSGTPKGAGINGIEDNYIYINGLRRHADDGAKYGVITYSKTSGETTTEKQYVVNESGAIQKSKKNLKDSDGYYYCTNSKGELLHGPNSEKCTESH